MKTFTTNIKIVIYLIAKQSSLMVKKYGKLKYSALVSRTFMQLVPQEETNYNNKKILKRKDKT